MGNELERTHPTVVYYNREDDIPRHQNAVLQTDHKRCSEQVGHVVPRMGKIDNVDQDWRKCSRSEKSNSRNKKYLSLTKENRGRRNIFMESNASVEKKTGLNVLTRPNSKQSLVEIVNYSEFNREGNGQRERKSSIVKPRDLPRCSSQKVIRSPLDSRPSSMQKIPSGRIIYDESPRKKEIIHSAQVIQPVQNAQPQPVINILPPEQPQIKIMSPPTPSQVQKYPLVESVTYPEEAEENFPQPTRKIIYPEPQKYFFLEPKRDASP